MDTTSGFSTIFTKSNEFPDCLAASQALKGFKAFQIGSTLKEKKSLVEEHILPLVTLGEGMQNDISIVASHKRVPLILISFKLSFFNIALLHYTSNIQLC